MARFIIAFAFGLFLIDWNAFGQQNVAPTPHLSPEKEKAKIQLPPGFELQLVAAEPDIRKPMNIAFDDKGRLWITESEEYPYPAPADRKGKDAVKILEDFGPDGKARKITTFADGLNIPIGILPVKDGAIVYSIPNIWKLTDTDGDGKCDKREVLFGPFGTRDTHGMTNSFTMGFDGWIYACHGYLNDTEIKGKDGHVVKMNSGNTFRFKPDGSRVELYTRGQVNPFGMSWDPYGNLYTADCHSRPITQLIRGAMYESFSKPHDGLGFAPHMNDFKDHSTALCGIVYYAADYFPKEYHDHLFLGDVVMNRVNSYKVEYTGSSPRAIRQDFLTSEDPWFRPVDLKLGPDGALYIADFYNKIIGHYEVPLNHPERDRTSGRIWRVVRKDANGKVVPPIAPIADYRKATDAELIKALAHPNLTAAMNAMHELAARGPEVAEVVSRALLTEWDPDKGLGFCHALCLWIGERIGLEQANRATQMLFQKSSPQFQTHVLRMLEDHPNETGWHKVLSDKLDDKSVQFSPIVRRVALETLARHPSNGLIFVLAAARSFQEQDRHAAYAIRLAIRSHLQRVPNIWSMLPSIVKDDYERQLIADAIPGAPSPEAAGFLLDFLSRASHPTERQARWVQFIARHGSDDTSIKAMQYARKYKNPEEQIGLLLALHRGLIEAAKPPAKELFTWAEELKAATLDRDDDAAIRSGAELASALRLTSATHRLVVISTDRKRDAGVRGVALAALISINAPQHTSLAASIVIDATEPSDLRQQAIRLLTGLNSKEARSTLVGALATVPGTLASVIGEGLAGSREGAEELLAAVAGGKASPRLLQEQPVKVRLQQLRLPNINERIAKLTAGFPSADQRMNDLFQRRLHTFRTANRSPEVGARVYEKHCAICHQLGGKGAKIGPQLDGIGKRGVERLLEDLLDPNRNIDPAFRTTRIVLKNGRDLFGLFLRDDGDVTVLADNQGKEIRVPRAQIDEKSVIPLSPMPANLVDQIPETEFLHLLEFLLQQTAALPEKK